MRKVLRLAWFERTHTFRTSRALVVMLAIVVAVCYCLQGFVVSAVRSHASNVEKHSNVSVIELSTIRPDARVLTGNHFPKYQDWDMSFPWFHGCSTIWIWPTKATGHLQRSAPDRCGPPRISNRGFRK